MDDESGGRGDFQPLVWREWSDKLDDLDRETGRRRDTEPPIRRAVAAGLLTGLLALGGLVYRAHTVTLMPGVAYAPAFRGALEGPAAMLNAHDGQAFGSLALDPLLSRGPTWTHGRATMAYRAGRPLLGWLVMLTSFGSTWLAQWSLVVWTAVGAGLLAAGASLLAGLWGRRTEWIPLLLLLPGVFGQLLFGGLADGLAAGLALLGMVWWLQARDGRAIAALSLAALGREAALLVALALMLGTALARARKLLVPFCVYAGWVGLVWLRLQTSPVQAGSGRLGVPFAGLVVGVRSWTWLEVVCAASVVSLAAIAFSRAPCPEVRWLGGLSVLFAATFGAEVWESWDFTRPLLPVTVVGACLLARETSDAADGREGFSREPAR
ncbi:MAG: hypothetical protein M3144_12345 [Actinomycetota bacterium]|nr:hypothetical protein [Actinomycetota bacterium]